MRPQDPHGEFFVVKQLDAAACTASGAVDMWRDGYVIDEARVPSFLGPQLASKILRAGKSVNFLKVCVCLWGREM